MKLLVILAVGCLGVTATISEENSSRIHGENGWYVPVENDSLIWVDKEKAEYFLQSRQFKDLFHMNLTPVKFYLYTRPNPTKGREITENIKSVRDSNFNPLHPTRFIIHGFTQSGKSNMNKAIRDAWLKQGDYNVIVVDWGSARTPDYASAVRAVPTVGKKVAEMIDMMVQYHHMNLDTLHVAGHSLGAHVAGYAGKALKSGKIHTIIGLDPALPLFSYDKPAKRLNSTDAFYVESIQTNGGGLGFLLPIGKSAFYPNGGVKQPGCPTVVCSHERSISYYAESISQDNFGAILCHNLEDAVAKNCGDQFSSIRMGAESNAVMVEGIFNVPVNKKAPFGILS